MFPSPGIAMVSRQIPNQCNIIAEIDSKSRENYTTEFNLDSGPVI